MYKKLISPYFLLLILLIPFTNCKKLLPNTTITYVSPTLSTSAPTFSSGNITFNGNILTLGNGYTIKGFVWGVNTNPDINSNAGFVQADGTGSGAYIVTYPTASFNLTSGSTYNVRAFAESQGDGSYAYGNNITFTIP